MGEEASIAIDGSARPHVAYWNHLAGGIRYAYNDGTDWKNGWEIEEVPNGNTITWQPAIAVYQDTVHIAFYDVAAGKVKYAKGVAGEEFYAAAVEPDAGETGKTLSSVKISGGGFKAGAAVTLEHQGCTAIAGANIKVVSQNEIRVDFAVPLDACLGDWDLVVTNPDDATAFLTEAVTITAQGIPAGVKKKKYKGVITYSPKKIVRGVPVTFTVKNPSAPKGKKVKFYYWDLNKDKIVDSNMKKVSTVFESEGKKKITVQMSDGNSLSKLIGINVTCRLGK